MPKDISILVLALLLSPGAIAASSCPVLLVSGAADADIIAVTFRDVDKLPIRRLEFNCNPGNTPGGKPQRIYCYEANASFIPRTEYTVKYSYPPGVRGPILVSLKSVTFSDGHTWKPSRREPCRMLKIALPKQKPRS